MPDYTHLHALYPFIFFRRPYSLYVLFLVLSSFVTMIHSCFLTLFNFPLSNKTVEKLEPPSVML